MSDVDSKPWEQYCVIPPEDHKDVGKEIFRILAIVVADKVKLGLHDRWMRNYELRKNQHWRTSTKKSSVPLVTANLIYTHIQRTVNMLTDNNPTFNVAQIGRASEEEKELFLDLQHTAEYWWNEQEQQDVLETSLLNGEEYGITIEKVHFNPDLEGGFGEIETTVVDPFHFGFYPVKMRDPKDIQKCEAVLHYYPKSVRELRIKCPNKAKEIKSDDELIKEIGDERREIASSDSNKTSSLLISIANAVKHLINYSFDTSREEEEEETLVCEMWVRDRTEDKDGNAKYPGNIRCILACSGGNVVLEDKPNPSINPQLSPEQASKTYLWDKYPFSASVSVKDTANSWGMTDIEQVEWLNMELNKAISQFVLEKDRSARRKVINPKTSGVTNDQFTNYPGIINPVNTIEAAAIRYLDVPASSVDYDKAIALFKDLFFLIVGTFELDQAQVKGREVIAYKAIAALMERVATMMRGKIRGYGRLIRERGRMSLSHVMNWYTEERWITYTEKDGTEVTKPIVGTDMIVPAKLTVVTGSTMPISKIAQRDEALELFKAGAIDQQELLDRLDYSNRTELIKRMQLGPLSDLIQKLAAIGMPPEMLQLLQQLTMMEPKQFEQAVKQGQIPDFQQLLQAMSGQEPPPDPESTKKMAEVGKVQAEIALIREKIVTERVGQQVKLAGIRFDEEKLKIERAKVVQELENQERETSIVSAQGNKPGYNETGMVSNNVQQ